MTKFLKQLLKNKLEGEEIDRVFSSFDVIGDIIINKIPDVLLSKKRVIGNILLENIPHIKSVYMQKSSVSGEFRLRQLDLIAGSEKYLTIYREHGCHFLVNVATTYFSPRLSTERLRISSLVSKNEFILNLFAGIGTFSILIAKKLPVTIYSIDSNLDAYILSLINTKINKVKQRHFSIHGNAANILLNDSRFTSFKNKMNRILMPLPEHAFEFIDLAVKCIHVDGGHIHFFAHIKCENKSHVIENSEKNIRSLFSNYNYKIDHTQIVRPVAPRLYQTVTDVFIKK